MSLQSYREWFGFLDWLLQVVGQSSIVMYSLAIVHSGSESNTSYGISSNLIILTFSAFVCKMWLAVVSTA